MPSELVLDIDPANHKEFGPCDCCGTLTHRVWGNIERDGATLAVYSVEWTPGHEERQANFDFIIGPWGEGTDGAERFAVSLAYRVFDTGPSFMVMDSTDRPFGKSALTSKALTRDEVIGQPIAKQVFDFCDAIYLKDIRIAALTV